MSKCRVWYWPNGKISVSYPDLRYDKFKSELLESWNKSKSSDFMDKEWLVQKPQDYGDADWIRKKPGKIDDNKWLAQKPQDFMDDMWLLNKSDDFGSQEWLAQKPKDPSLDEWIDSQFGQVAIKAPQFAGLEFQDMDTSQLPQDRPDRDRWRGSKATGIKVDNTVVLRKDLFQQIDDELAGVAPDMVAVERLRRKVEREDHE